jgi:hypothetical protein
LRKLLTWVLFALLVLAGGYFGAYLIALTSARGELAAAIVEVDAAEPGGWQLEDLEARRPAVPDDRNNAKQIQDVAAHIPPDWKPSRVDFTGLRPCDALADHVASALTEELTALESTRVAARRLADCPTGRFPCGPLTGEFVFRDPPHRAMVTNTTFVLYADAVLLAHQHELEAAWRNGQAILHAGRSVAGEPDTTALLIRTAGHYRAVLACERILGQGTVSAEQLAAARQVLAEEMGDNLLEPALCGERAGLSRFFSDVAAGTVDFPGIGQHWIGTYTDIAFSPVGLRGATIRNSHAYLLRHLTRSAAAAKKLDHEAYAAHEAARTESMEQRANYQIPALAVAWVAANQAIIRTAFRARTHLACADVALAAEQYRLREKRWPESLADLTKSGHLAKIPLDIYDGQPLHLRLTADGLVIYSVGELKRYEGTARDAGAPAVDIGLQECEFRLWNVNDRRQALKDT